MGHAKYDLTKPLAEAKMVICGGGHVALKTIALARLCDFHVTVLEDRPEYADKAREAGADEVLLGAFEERLQALPCDEDTFFVIVTRGHKHDIDCLRIALKKPSAYLGMIGSKKKVALVKDALLKEGVSENEWDKVHAPIGIEIHAETPEEIAVAILAEVILVKNTNGHNYGVSKEVSDALRHLQADPDRDAHAVLASVIEKRGSAPRGAGAKMIVYEDGHVVGTVGGGKGEAIVIEEAKRVLREMTNRTVPNVITVQMTSEAVTDEGMICGGEIDVSLELL